MKEVIGIIPAAGQGTRVAYLPCSKEVFPIGFRTVKSGHHVNWVPKAVGLYTMEQMIKTGAKRIFIVIGEGKWDIPKYFGDGSRFGVSIAYLLQEHLSGMPGALNLARPWLKNEVILFGMPDTIIEPSDAFAQALKVHEFTKADVTLGAFPTSTPERFGMVKFAADGRLIYTEDKPLQTNLEYMWGFACWERTFVNFMSDHLRKIGKPQQEIVIGDIFQAGLDAGLRLQVVPFAQGRYIDIGVPNGLMSAVSSFSLCC